MEKEIRSIEEFLSECFRIQDKIDICNDDSCNTGHIGLAFRGQENKHYKLIPSIGRREMDSCQTPILDQERNLIEMAKYKLPHIFRLDLQPIDLLALLP